jgi:hypothetical protein
VWHSWAIQEVFEFVEEREMLSYQRLNRHFYKKLPQMLTKVRLGKQALNKMFSYGLQEYDKRP